MPNKNFLLVKKEKGNPMVYSMIPEHKMGLLAETSLTGHCRRPLHSKFADLSFVLGFPNVKFLGRYLFSFTNSLNF